MILNNEEELQDWITFSGIDHVLIYSDTCADKLGVGYTDDERYAVVELYGEYYDKVSKTLEYPFDSKEIVDMVKEEYAKILDKVSKVLNFKEKEYER